MHTRIQCRMVTVAAGICYCKLYSAFTEARIIFNAASCHPATMNTD